jgi:hypothetical protein
MAKQRAGIPKQYEWSYGNGRGIYHHDYYVTDIDCIKAE